MKRSNVLMILFFLYGSFCFADPVPQGSTYPGTDIPLQLGGWHQLSLGGAFYGDGSHVHTGVAATGYILIDMAKTKLSIDGTLILGQGNHEKMGGHGDLAISFRKLWPLLEASQGSYSKLWFVAGGNIGGGGSWNASLDPWFLNVQPVIALEIPFVLDDCVIKYDFLRAGLGVYQGTDPHSAEPTSTSITPPNTFTSHLWPVLRPSAGTEFFAKCKNGFETRSDLQYIFRSFGPDDAAALTIKLAYDHPLYDAPLLSALGVYVQANVIAQGKLFQEITSLMNNHVAEMATVGISLQFDRQPW